MKYFSICLLFFLVTAVHCEEMPIVKIKTNFGTIILELDSEKAPNTVENFLRYVEEGFYEGTIFHRVIRHFVIQGGGYTQSYEKKQTYDPIPNESHNGLKNLRGTIAMGRGQDPHSATSQFFININNNEFLNFQSSMYSQWGYTVFGHVMEGMDVVNKIQKAKTSAKGPFKRHVPIKPILIKKITVKNIPIRKKTPELSTFLDVPDSMTDGELDGITDDDFLETITSDDTVKNIPIKQKASELSTSIDAPESMTAGELDGITDDDFLETITSDDVEEDISSKNKKEKDILDISKETKEDILDTNNDIEVFDLNEKKVEMPDHDEIDEIKEEIFEASNKREKNVLDASNEKDIFNTSKKKVEMPVDVETASNFKPKTSIQVTTSPISNQPKIQLQVKKVPHTLRDTQPKIKTPSKTLQIPSNCQLKVDTQAQILPTPTIFLSKTLLSSCDPPSEPDKPEPLSD
ncbi:peptidylprolyl isomerase [Candidatus Parabeggiatoa sp. HSG14]|uniref:peptidylprolyl isomerase n=1 Tax=Candidatus Parabeggiatoa sp. HSG14 TaxID=3055593 RepID=UPI0025A7EF4D|nr:peptidylprolyl isomerase [Thiotrichales bacterium HSG14]